MYSKHQQFEKLKKARSKGGIERPMKLVVASAGLGKRVGWKIGGAPEVVGSRFVGGVTAGLGEV